MPNILKLLDKKSLDEFIKVAKQVDKRYPIKKHKDDYVMIVKKHGRLIWYGDD